MISLHITLYDLDDGDDRFKVTTVDTENGEPVDVTDQYEVVAVATPEGQPGFGVFKRAPAGSVGAPGSDEAPAPDQGGA